MSRLMLFWILFWVVMPGFASEGDVVRIKCMSIDSLLSVGQPNMALKLINVNEREAFNRGDNVAFFKAIKQRVEASRLIVPDSRLVTQSHIDSLVKLQKEGIYNALLCSILADYKQTDGNRHSTFAINQDYDEMGAVARGLYDMAVEESKELDSVSLSNYSFLLDDDDYGYLVDRGTLRYFILLKASDFYTRNMDDNTDEAVYVPQLLLPSANFVRVDIGGLALTKGVEKALMMYQELERYGDAYLKNYAFLSRLEFVNGYFDAAMPKSGYTDVLDAAYLECKDKEACAEILLRKAQQLRIWGEEYGNGKRDEVAYDFFIQAAAVCEIIVDKYKNTDSYEYAIDLLNSIDSRVLSLSFDRVVPVESGYSFGEVSMRNVQEVEIVVIPSDTKSFYRNIKTALNMNDYSERPVASVKLVNDSCSDRREHRVKFKMPKLKSGYYILAAKSDSVFKGSPLYISNIAYLVRHVDKQTKLLVLDRNTGVAISGAEVSVFDGKRKLICRMKSDKQGYVTVPEEALSEVGSGRTTVLSISYKKDTLLSVEDLFKPYFYNQKEELACDIITDRQTYRPGDSVRYKVIVREGRENSWVVKSNHITSVMLRDTEYNTVQSDTIVTNEFGSGSGVFYIPQGLRNGRFQLHSKNGSAYIRVENFKLPTFEVKMTTTEDEYRIGDTIRIKGTALSYAGFPISNAEVKYTISMSRLMPYRIGGRDVVNDISGELHTDRNGVFCIEYIPLKANMLGMYDVEAFVTDISGETQSGEGRFVVQYGGDEPPVVVDDAKLPEFKVESVKEIYRVGEVAKIAVSSCFKDATVQYVISNNTSSKSAVLKLNNSTEIVEIPINETDRGGVTATFSMVYKNKLYSMGSNIAVPFDNKELVITSKTIRDKVRPGDKESWTISVVGDESDGQLSEVAVTMYDAALDVFGAYYWDINPYRMKYNYMWMLNKSIGSVYDQILYGQPFYNYAVLLPPRYNFISPFYRNGPYAKMSKAITEVANDVASSDQEYSQFAPSAAMGVTKQETKTAMPRTNFRNTVFFYPALRADSTGSITINFTMPDAITRWRFLAFAHTKDFKIGSFSANIESLRQLMIVANTPSFLRSGDKIDFAARATNLTDTTITAFANLLITTTNNGDTVINSQQRVVLKPHSNVAISWDVTVPENVTAVKYLLTIESEQHQDGETNVIAVLPSTVIFTETLSVSDAKLQELNRGENIVIPANTKTDVATIEVTINPIWLVVQALPSIVNNDKGSAMKLLDNYSAIAITSKIVKDNPQIKHVSQLWDAEGSSYLSSLIFDEQSTKNSLDQLLKEIASKQSKNGGWSWFDGMQENLFITCKMLSRIGKLCSIHDEHSHGESHATRSAFGEIIPKAIEFIDREELKLKHKSLSSTTIEYIYAKSFFLDDEKGRKFSMENYLLIDTIMQLAEQTWLQQTIENQAKLAFAFHRFGSDKYAHIVVDSFRDRITPSLSTATLTAAYEAAKEIEGETPFTRNLLQWLIRNKQTTDWGSTVATAEACLAVTASQQFRASNISDGREHRTDYQFSVNKKVMLDTTTDNPQAGTGYIKKEITTDHKPIVISSPIVVVEASVQSTLPIINIYYQYPEFINKIPSHQNGLTVDYELFKTPSIGSSSLATASPSASSTFSVGDIITVKITFSTDREMSFVAITHQRAAALQPVDQQSGYRYFGNVGAYINQEDSQTQLFIEKLQAGTYIVEYKLKATQCGTFSNGFTEIQCQYAPQFKANTTSKKLIVTN